MATSAAALACALGAGGCGDDGVPALLDASPADASPADAAVPAPAAVVFVDDVDFGLSDCGGSAPDAQLVRLRNNGDADLVWSALVRFSAAFQLEDSNGGTLAPGEQIDLTVVAAPIAADAVAGAVTFDILQITTNDPHRGAIELPLSVTAAGAVLTIFPSVADFGAAPIGVDVPAIPLEIRNEGNRAATVTLVSPASGSLGTEADDALVDLAPGAVLPGAAATFAPASTDAVTATATLEVTGAVCAGSMTDLELRGRGTSGAAAVGPGTVDFGATACGADVAPQTFTIHNYGDVPFTFDAALVAGEASRYQLVPTTATVAAGQHIDVTAYAQAMPALSATTEDLYGEDVVVTTDLDDEVYAVHLRSTAAGGLLVAEEAVVDLERVPFGTTSSARPFVLRNDGNAAISVTPIFASAEIAVAWSGTGTVAGGASLIGSATFQATELGTFAAPLEFEVEGPLCGPVPSMTVQAETSLGGTARDVAISVGASWRSRNHNGPSTICTIIASGNVVCLGPDDGGLRGDGAATSDPDVPSFVTTSAGRLGSVVELTGGLGFMCARTEADELWCWGSVAGPNPWRGGTAQYLAVQIGAGDVAAAAAGYHYLCTVTSGGALDCQGGGGNQASYEDSWVYSGVASVDIHSSGGAAVVGDQVYTFGSNNSGERGSNVVANAAPSLVPGLSDVDAVSAGGANISRAARTVCASTSAGAMWCWGRGRHGNLGNGATNTQSVAPVRVLTAANTPLVGVTEMAVAKDHTCAIAGGSVWCWGRGFEGQLGFAAGDYGYARRPQPAINNATHIDTFNRRSCAVTSNGRVLCWGLNQGTTSVTTPTPLAPFEP
jgi:hypothetical protein